MSRRNIVISCIFVLSFLFISSIFYFSDKKIENKINETEALTVQAITVVPRLEVSGQVRPQKTWAAICQNEQSRVVWASPKTNNGLRVEKNEVLLKLRVRNNSNNKSEVIDIVAPFKGLIKISNIEIGQEPLLGATMLTLDSLDNAEITIGLNNEKLAMLTDLNQTKEALATAVKNSLSQAWVEVLAEGNNKRQAARLSSRPVSMSPKGLLEASLLIEEAASPGTPHQVFINAPAKKSQIVIPRQALNDEEVFVLDSNMRLKKRRVKVSYTLNKYAVIKEGLTEGETLIIGDSNLLKPGERISLNMDSQFYQTAISDLS